MGMQGELTSPVRTAAIILAALNLDLWYSIKQECINSTTVTTALMSKEVLCLALLTWLMENSISVWLLSLWWERQVSWTPEAIAELNFFSTLGEFSCILWPWPWKRKNNTLDFFYIAQRGSNPTGRAMKLNPSLLPVRFNFKLQLCTNVIRSGPDLNSKLKQLHTWRSLQIETQTESGLQDKDFLPWIYSPSRLKKYWLCLWWILKIAPIPVAH